MTSNRATAIGGRVRLRILLLGCVLPAAAVSLAWALCGVWTELPDQLPSHWSASGADSFDQAGAVIRNWVIFGYAAALCGIGVTVAAIHETSWSTFGRSAVAVMVGLSGAVACTLVVQLIAAHGRTTGQVAELGFWPYLLSLLLGFALFCGVALTALPPARGPASRD